VCRYVAVVRDEIKNIAPYYTDGEIWLGKGDAGAQISVKSVRGEAESSWPIDRLKAPGFNS
jgi:hypothetical protein